MTSLLHTYQPLDYSYLNIRTMNDLLDSEPHNDSQSEMIQRNKLELNKLKQQQVESEQMIPAVIRTLNAIRNSSNNNENINNINNNNNTDTTNQLYQREPVITHGIKLCYNNITSLSNMNNIIDKLIYNSLDIIKWIDLSYNKLTLLDTELLNYHNLTVLYINNNNISSFSEIYKLHKLYNLQKLQLQNNPIYDSDHNGGCNKARAIIISILPQLRVLDSVNITQAERELSNRYFDTLNKKILKKLQLL